MRQVKNCKVGHFVKYEGVLCQVNCFYSNWRGKFATLVEVGFPGEPKRCFTPEATEKVEYFGDTAKDDNGHYWVFKRRDIVDEWNRR